MTLVTDRAAEFGVGAVFVLGTVLPGGLSERERARLVLSSGFSRAFADGLPEAGVAGTSGTADNGASSLLAKVPDVQAAAPSPPPPFDRLGSDALGWALILLELIAFALAGLGLIRFVRQRRSVA